MLLLTALDTAATPVPQPLRSPIVYPSSKDANGDSPLPTFVEMMTALLKQEKINPENQKYIPLQ